MTRARDVANLIGSGNYSSTTFTATAGQTAFTISHTQGFIQVFMNGLLLDETVDYTSNGSAVTLTSGAAAGDEIEVVAYNTFSVGDALNQAAADARYYTQSAADTRYVNTSGDTMTGNLTVSGGVVAATGTSTLANSEADLGIYHSFKNLSSDVNTGVGISLGSNNNSGATIYAQRTGANNEHKLGFQTRNNSGSGLTRMAIDGSGRVTMPYQPSFAARGLSSGASGIDQVFSAIRYNVGNHYSSSTGRFTCPVDGTYLFGWTNISNTANDVYRYYIRVNGSSNISGTGNDTHLRVDTGATGSEYGTNAMFTWPVQLSANDYVNIYYYSDGGTSTYTGSDYPQFWGYLVG